VPDLDEPADNDLRTSYHENRPWLYGILAIAVIVSLTEDAIDSGGIPTDLDALFRIAFLAVAVVGWAFRSERIHYIISASLLASFVVYILLLFLRLG
jgi:hypothetical protein